MDSYRSSRLEALEALEKAATTGPWGIGFLDGSGVGTEDQGAWILARDSDETVVVWGGKDDWGSQVGVLEPADAALITEARNLLPALIAVARAAEAWKQVNDGYRLGLHDAPSAIDIAISDLMAALRPLLDEGDAR